LFTGIVQAVGRIVAVEGGPALRRILVAPGTLDLADVAIGDSIAVSGCCLTVVHAESGERSARLAFDVSAETLACTTGLDAIGPVNLEKSLRLADRLGGHLVTGHVDGIGTVVVHEDADGSRRLEVEVPPALARYIAAKGSIAVQGVSLTVNRIDGLRFEVNLIPHTLQATTLAGLTPGHRVNLEIDLVARYVERLLTAPREA
jgi:riboflavin synthase